MSEAPKATRREWIGLAVIALPCLLYSMDLTVLNVAVPLLTFLGSMAALYGGGLVCWVYGGIQPEVFLSRLREAISLDHFVVGIRFTEGKRAELPIAARQLVERGADILVTGGGGFLDDGRVFIRRRI